MKYHYPTPQEVGVKIPPHLMADRFSAGFEHALKGGQLNKAEYFRLSFREGFRSAKLYLRYWRRKQGVVDFPCRYKFRFKAVSGISGGLSA